MAYSAAIISRTCPTCGSTENSGVVAQAKVRAEEKLPGEIETHWRGFRAERCFFSYAGCQQCNTLYCPLYFSSQHLDSLYSNMGDNSMGQSLLMIQRTQMSYAKKILNVAGPIKRILDFGADVGHLSKAFVSLNDTFVVDAVEPNKNVWSQLRENLPRDGHIFGDFASVPQEAKYDLIVGVHVLDHLLDPMQYLQKAREHLSKDGVLALVTHDESSMLRKVLGSKWPPFCLQHPQLYRESTIRFCLLNSGFEQVSSSKTTNYVSLRDAGSILFSSVGVPPSLAKLIPNLNIGLRLGNILTTAKKRHSQDLIA